MSLRSRAAMASLARIFIVQDGRGASICPGAASLSSALRTRVLQTVSPAAHPRDAMLLPYNGAMQQKRPFRPIGRKGLFSYSGTHGSLYFFRDLDSRRRSARNFRRKFGPHLGPCPVRHRRVADRRMHRVGLCRETESCPTLLLRTRQRTGRTLFWFICFHVFHPAFSMPGYAHLYSLPCISAAPVLQCLLSI